MLSNLHRKSYSEFEILWGQTKSFFASSIFLFVVVVIYLELEAKSLSLNLERDFTKLYLYSPFNITPTWYNFWKPNSKKSFHLIHKTKNFTCGEIFLKKMKIIFVPCLEIPLISFSDFEIRNIPYHLQQTWIHCITFHDNQSNLEGTKTYGGNLA